MEVIFLFFIPLAFYVILKIAILRDKDQVSEDYRRFSEGIRLIEFGFIEEALLYFDRAVKDYPKSTVAYATRGKCHLHLKNYYQAIYNFDKAASFSNDLPEVFLHKGIALYKIEDYEAALKEFNKAVWFYREKNASAYRWRGHTNKKLGNKELADKDFMQAAQLGNEAALSTLKKL